MTNLTIDDVLRIHELSSNRFSAAADIQDKAALQAAIDTWNAELYGSPTYNTLYEKAAALARGIICDRPFSHGNRRTGMLAALTLLKMNGTTITITPGELHDFASNVAVHRYGVPAIALWFESHASALPVAA